MTDEPGPEPTRTAILSAAEQAFGTNGYRRTTIDGVARSAGVSRALVYRYFSDKQELYRQVVANVLGQWHEALVTVSERPAPTWGHTMRQVIHTCVEWAAERRVLWGVLVRDADVAQRIAGPTMEEGRALLPQLLESLLSRGVEEGDVRADLAVPDMAFVIAEVTIAASFQAMRSGDPAVRAARLEAMVETLLHGVLLT